MKTIEAIKKRIAGDITLKQLMENSDKAVFCRDFSGKIIYWNKGAEALYGYPSDEVEGQSVSLIKPQNYPVELPFIDERIKRGEQIKDLETTRIDRKGRVMNVLSTIIPIEESGKHIGAIHVEKNITSEKTELHEKRFRKILESFPDVIFELSSDYTIIWANKVALDIEPLAVGKKCYQAYMGLQRPCDGCAIVQALETGVSQQSVTHHEDFQNEEKFWENLAIPVKDAYGNISSIIEISRDITTRKQAEKELLRTKERLELAMKAGNVAWWIWDYKSGVVEYDKRKAEMAGYSYEEFPKNVYKITDLLHPDDYDKTMKVMTDHLKGHTPEYRIDYRLKTKNGEYVWFHDRGKVIERQEDGTPVRLSGAVIDITKRKEVEEKLRRALERQKMVDKSLKAAKNQAEEANQAKSDFLANMSHEIRTPLNGIVGFTELLRKTDLSMAQKKYMDHVHNSATALMDIINDILDFSKIEAGKLELNYEKTDLNELISNSLDVIKFKVRDKDIRLIKEIDEEIPPFILTDPIRLRQILTNLLSNAAKFTENGEIRISVKAIEWIQKAAILHVKFMVKDTGIGISRDNQQKVFQSFSQADYSTTKKYGGTGLGLSITNSLLNLMGSKLSLESELDKGSVFSFMLELKAFQSTEQSRGNNLEKGKEVLEIPASEDRSGFLDVSQFRTNPVKIMIAEDNEVNMELTEIIIKDVFDLLSEGSDSDSPVKIIKAVNGKEAVEQYMKESPEIVFLDIQMPFKNGYQVTQKIRANESSPLKPYIIALTAAAVKGEREKCLQTGMDEYLTKPVVNEAIKCVLKDYLIQIHSEMPPLVGQEKRRLSDKEVSRKQTDKLLHFNSEQLRAVFKDDEKMYTHILTIGKKSLIEDVEKLTGYFLKGEITGVKKTAHKIKGVALNLRCEKLQQQAEQLEKAAGDNTSIESLRPLYQSVIEEIRLLEKLLRH